MKDIWDVKRPYRPPKLTDKQYDEVRRYGHKHAVMLIDTDILITELQRRGTTIEDVFRVYYALEEQAAARDDELFGNDEEGQHGRPRLTVGDAELAGLVNLPTKPKERQPF